MNITKYYHPLEDEIYKYDVTLSFAEEDRAFVERVAAELQKSGLRFYYDEYELIDMWGKNLYTHLDDIYRNKARYCIIFISKYYKRKLWTQHERESAQARAFIENREYILPFRFDDTEIAGILNTVTYLSSKEYDSTGLANAIVQKVSGQRLPSVQQKKTNVFPKLIIPIAFIVVSITIYIFSDRLTPVNTLTLRLYEKSKRQAKYSRCKDGHIRPSTGPGTCSHHGGVDTNIDTVIYDKTIPQCRQEAIAISWLPQ